MAGSYTHGSGTKHFIDELDVTCALNAGDHTVDREVHDARTFCGNEQVPGNRKAGATFGGLGMWGDDEYEDVLTNRMQSGANVNRLTIFGTSAGSQSYEVLGPLSKESHAWKAADILGLNGEVGSADSMMRGLALHVGAPITATGAQTGQNAGAVAATETYEIVIRVTAVSGSGSLTIQSEESSDDGGADAYAQVTGLTIETTGSASAGTDDVTFTGTGTARLYKTGAVEAWRRINVTAFSGFTSVTATVTTGTQMPD